MKPPTAAKIDKIKEILKWFRELVPSQKRLIFLSFMIYQITLKFIFSQKLLRNSSNNLWDTLTY